jgi:hypothetical protein
MRLLEWIDSLPPYKHDAALIVLKMGIILAFSGVAFLLNVIARFVGFPWAYLFYGMSLVVIGATLGLIGYILWNELRNARSKDWI